MSDCDSESRTADGLPPGVRVLAIDLGSKRIGLALTDPDRRIASPAGVMERRGGAKDLAALDALCRERGVGVVVVGLPLHMSGRRGPGAEAAERFAEQLRDATGLRVELLDERWTTREATRALHTMGRNTREQRGIVDEVAAALLLDTWLARERNAVARRA